jgi:hypothetical protein
MRNGGNIMRVSSLVAAACILFGAWPVAGQARAPQAAASRSDGERAAGTWREFVSQKDFFIVNFPGEPVVADLMYPTEYGITLPARVYTVRDQASRYSVTVVDYSTAAQTHTDRVRNCQGYPDTCTNRGPNDLRGALDYAVSTFIQRDAKVTYYAYADTDRVEGRRVQLTNADRSTTFVAIYMHDNRLYILDGTVSPTTPPPALFQQSLGFFDNEGIRVRYQTIYRHGHPPPPREETRGRLAGC